jgi:PAS domain S-box-containing protein
MTELIGSTVSQSSDEIERITLEIASSLDLDATFSSIASAAATLTDATTSALYVRGAGGDYTAVAAHGLPLRRLQKEVRLTSSTGLLERIIRTGEPAQVVDFERDVNNSSDRARRLVRDLGALSTLGVPLLQDGECIGALYVARAVAEPFPDKAVRLLQRLAAHAQIALRNAERFATSEGERLRLQSYLDAVPEGVMVMDRQGVIVLTNSSLERELSVGRSMVGLDHMDAFDEADPLETTPVRFRFDRKSVFERVLKSGEAEQGLVELGQPSRMFEVNYSPLRGNKGRIDGVVATMRDITTPLELERIRARTNLLADLLELSAHLNSELSIPILIERVVEAAMALIDTATGTLGLVEGDRLVFRRFHSPAGWQDFDVSLQIGQGAPGHVWQTGRPFISNDTRNDRVVLQDYRQRLQFSRLACVPVFDRSTRVIGALGVYDPRVERDFTQADVEVLQLLAHQAAIAIENARLNEVKDEFLSIVSHELKTPVTSIKGFTQILQRRLADDAGEGTRRYLDVINHQADRLTSLINDLLDLSRIQTGRFVFNLERVDYASLVRDVLAETTMVSANNAITYTGPEHVFVRGNANRLRQVLVNLVDNGIKHGPPNGSIHVTVEADGDKLVTYVCDEGPGLPPAEAERVFAQYYQVRQGSERQARGLGLGLFISRQIVTEHGGRIWLDDVDHTSFCFTLNLTESDAAEHADEDVHAHDLSADRTLTLG